MVVLDSEDDGAEGLKDLVTVGIAEWGWWKWYNRVMDAESQI